MEDSGDNEIFAQMSESLLPRFCQTHENINSENHTKPDYTTSTHYKQSINLGRISHTMTLAIKTKNEFKKELFSTYKIYLQNTSNKRLSSNIWFHRSYRMNAYRNGLI